MPLFPLFYILIYYFSLSNRFIRFFGKSLFSVTAFNFMIFFLDIFLTDKENLRWNNLKVSPSKTQWEIKASFFLLASKWRTICCLELWAHWERRDLGNNFGQFPTNLEISTTFLMDANSAFVSICRNVEPTPEQTNPFHCKVALMVRKLF